MQALSNALAADQDLTEKQEQANKARQEAENPAALPMLSYMHWRNALLLHYNLIASSRAAQSNWQKFLDEQNSLPNESQNQDSIDATQQRVNEAGNAAQGYEADRDGIETRAEPPEDAMGRRRVPREWIKEIFGEPCEAAESRHIAAIIEREIQLGDVSGGGSAGDFVGAGWELAHAWPDSSGQAVL